MRRDPDPGRVIKSIDSGRQRSRLEQAAQMRALALDEVHEALGIILADRTAYRRPVAQMPGPGGGFRPSGQLRQTGMRTEQVEISKGGAEGGVDQAEAVTGKP